jgi:RNA polymerase primary sigma factor
VASTEELACAAGLGVRETENLLRVQRQPLSIDGVGVKEGSRKLAEIIADPRQECPSDRLDQSTLERRIEEIFRNLDVRERQVLRMRYGLQGQQPLSLSDIGSILRVSKERIRQIEESAMSKLRLPQHAAQFVQFFHDSPERLMRAAAVLKGCDDLCDPRNRRSTARRRA